MKHSDYMIRLAARLEIKYAAIEAQSLINEIQKTITTAVGNASSYQSSGIMPFLTMLQKDGASLSLNVMRNGDDITVSSATVNPGEFAPKYSALPLQVQRYLEKNLRVFPSLRNGESINYHNLTLTLIFNAQPQVPIANRD